MIAQGSRAFLTVVVLGVSGCMPLYRKSPMLQAIVKDRLQLVCAGHTGCLPEDNVISNVKANADGSGTWNAMCKGKMYLCSAVCPTIAGSVGCAESFSCAPVAQ